ncbi:epimerase [Egicoccus sp. AB-alg2]|uniref:epimerase n=1 Tax=Egicoccus sp. AB-alg2 TaxID=3242693 RepID=UPI00359DAE30
MARVVLAGGSGYLGRHLAQRLRERGDEVVVLTRGTSGHRGGVRFEHWDGRTVGSWAAVLDGADALVNLAGRRVDVRPTRANVDDLRDSRVNAVRALGQAAAGLDEPPAVWVQVATMAVYGEGGEIVCDESVPPPPDGPRQMVGVATAWEAAFADAVRDRNGRDVLLRCGVVIGPGDPATAHLAWLARLGVGGRIGSGRQWVSWIALDDLLSVVVRAMDEPAMAGTYHVTSPQPVRNAALMAGVRRVVGRRWGLPIPAFGVHVGTWLLGSDAALPLTGRRGHPGRLLDERYRFTTPDLDAALATALAS